MKFSTYSEKWKVSECEIPPAELLSRIVEACSRRLPHDALGHAKAYSEFAGGRAFASSTLIPDGVSLISEGQYAGGGCEVGITLIFMGLSRELLRDVLLGAAEEVWKRSGCILIERMEV